MFGFTNDIDGDSLRILDENNVEVTNPDYTVGFVLLDTITHENSEVEIINRYVRYTDEELAEMEEQRNKPSPEERIAELEAMLNALLGVSE